MSCLICRSEIPRKAKSKISILSSSTFCFDDDEEEKVDLTEILNAENSNSASQGTYDALSQTTNTTTNIILNAYDTLSQATSNTTVAYDILSPIVTHFNSATSTSVTMACSGKEAETVQPPCEEVTREESLTNSSTSRSSFRDELLYHFECRLSDLGPRSKYPCLQKLGRSVTSGAYDGLEKKAGDNGQKKKTGRSHDALARKRVVRGGGGRRWRRHGGYVDAGRAKTVKQEECETRVEDIKNHKCKKNGERNDSSKNHTFQPDHHSKHLQERQYDALEPYNYDTPEASRYDTLEPYNYDSVDTY